MGCMELENLMGIIVIAGIIIWLFKDIRK